MFGTKPAFHDPLSKWWRSITSRPECLPDIDFGGDRVREFATETSDEMVSQVESAIAEAPHFAVRIPLELRGDPDRRWYRARVWIGTAEQYGADCAKAYHREYITADGRRVTVAG